jgi:hypothetical protein
MRCSGPACPLVWNASARWSAAPGLRDVGGDAGAAPAGLLVLDGHARGCHGWFSVLLYYGFDEAEANSSSRYGFGERVPTVPRLTDGLLGAATRPHAAPVVLPVGPERDVLQAWCAVLLDCLHWVVTRSIGQEEGQAPASASSPSVAAARGGGAGTTRDVRGRGLARCALRAAVAARAYRAYCHCRTAAPAPCSAPLQPDPVGAPPPQAAEAQPPAPCSAPPPSPPPAPPTQMLPPTSSASGTTCRVASSPTKRKRASQWSSAAAASPAAASGAKGTE